jgi:class 3 adenylate cyclase
MRLGSTALATERVERRLAAILAADVAGYSRLMRTDEEGTLARLEAHRRELIDPKSESTKAAPSRPPARMLVGFGSVVDALCCATEMQAAMDEGSPLGGSIPSPITRARGLRRMCQDGA